MMMVRNVKLDLDNQNVVQQDAQRARFISKDHIEPLEQVLTFFCKQLNIKYKQGINDVAAPFMWLAVHKQAQQLRKRQTSLQTA